MLCLHADSLKSAPAPQPAAAKSKSKEGQKLAHKPVLNGHGFSRAAKCPIKRGALQVAEKLDRAVGRGLIPGIKPMQPASHFTGCGTTLAGAATSVRARLVGQGFSPDCRRCEKTSGFCPCVTLCADRTDQMASGFPGNAQKRRGRDALAIGLPNVPLPRTCKSLTFVLPRPCPDRTLAAPLSADTTVENPTLLPEALNFMEQRCRLQPEQRPELIRSGSGRLPVWSGAAT